MNRTVLASPRPMLCAVALTELTPDSTHYTSVAVLALRALERAASFVLTPECIQSMVVSLSYVISHRVLVWAEPWMPRCFSFSYLLWAFFCVPVILHKTLSLSLFPPWGIWDLERVGPAQSFGSEVQEAKPHTGRHWRSNSTFCRSAFLLLWHIFLFNSVEIFLSSFFHWKPLLWNVEYSFTQCENVSLWLV